jgi:hypothetical protein
MIAPLCLDLKSDAFTLSCTQIDEMKLRLEFEMMVISFVMPQVLCEEADAVSESLIARSPIELCHSGLKGRARFIYLATSVDISLRVRPQRFAALPQIAQRGISEAE